MPLPVFSESQTGLFPPWTGVGKRIESKVRRALFEFGLLEGVEHLAVAVSGGKDSVTLLLMLKAILGRGAPDCKVSALFVGGDYSCGAGVSRSYLAGICGTVGVDLVCMEPPKRVEPLECYSCSRTRRSLLFDKAKELGATAVAFGHHRDDYVQTLLMNMLHKGEFAGMLPKLPMVHYGITILRPMLLVEEEEVRQFAKQQGFARVMCQCPVGQTSLRRRTEELLQKLEEQFPAARDNLLQCGLRYGSTKALEA